MKASAVQRKEGRKEGGKTETAGQNKTQQSSPSLSLESASISLELVPINTRVSTADCIFSKSLLSRRKRWTDSKKGASFYGKFCNQFDAPNHLPLPRSQYKMLLEYSHYR
jgi:hypothetical protein